MNEVSILDNGIADEIEGKRSKTKKTRKKNSFLRVLSTTKKSSLYFLNQIIKLISGTITVTVWSHKLLIIIFIIHYIRKRYPKIIDDTSSIYHILKTTYEVLKKEPGIILKVPEYPILLYYYRNHPSLGTTAWYWYIRGKLWREGYKIKH